MPLKRDEDNFGLAAFRAAINRQEGSFMRAATYIMTAPKNLGQRVAASLLDRGAKGRFIKQVVKSDDR